jgi:hypothetical protein
MTSVLRKPRRRHGPRTAVVLAGVVGLGLGGFATAARWWGLSAQYRQAADREGLHERMWDPYVASYERSLEEVSRRKAEVGRNAAEDRRGSSGDPDQVKTWKALWGRLGNRVDRSVGNYEADLADARRARDYCRSLRLKYEYLARHPWAARDPDPAPPRVYNRSAADDLPGGMAEGVFVERIGRSFVLRDQFGNVHPGAPASAATP